METTFPEGSTRNSNPSFQPARRKQALDLLAKWDDLTEKYDCTMAQLVIALTARTTSACMCCAVPAPRNRCWTMPVH